MQSHKKNLTLFIRFTLLSITLLMILWFAYLFYAKATIETKIHTALERTNQQLVKLTQFADFHYELQLTSIQQTLFVTDFEVTFHEIEHSKQGKSPSLSEENNSASNKNETNKNTTILLFKNHVIHGPFPFINQFNLRPAFANIMTQGFIPDSSTLEFIPIDLATDEPLYENAKNNIEPILLGETLFGLSGQFNSELTVPGFIASTKKQLDQQHTQQHLFRGLTLKANAEKNFKDLYINLSIRPSAGEDSNQLIANESDSLINNQYQSGNLSAEFLLLGIPRETLWDSDFSFILNIDKSHSQTNMPSSDAQKQYFSMERFNGIKIDYLQNWQEKKLNSLLDINFAGADYYSRNVVFNISPLSIQFDNQSINRAFLDTLSNFIESNISKKTSILAANLYRFDETINQSVKTLVSTLNLLASYNGKTNLDISGFTASVQIQNDESDNPESANNKQSSPEVKNVLTYSAEPINLVIDNLSADSPTNIALNLQGANLTIQDLNVLDLKALSVESTLSPQPFIPNIKWHTKLDELTINTDTEQNLFGLQNLDAQFNLNNQDTLFNTSKKITLDRFHFAGIDYGKWNAELELLNLDSRSTRNIIDEMKTLITQKIIDRVANDSLSSNSVIAITGNLKTLFNDHASLRLVLKNQFSDDDQNSIDVMFNFKEIDPLAIMLATKKPDAFDKISDLVISKTTISSLLNIPNIARLYALRAHNTQQQNSRMAEQDDNIQQIIQQIKSTVNQPEWNSIFQLADDNLISELSIQNGNVTLNGQQMNSAEFADAVAPLGEFLFRK